MTTPNPFENSVGHFWGIIEALAYMRARYGFVDELLAYFGYPSGRVDAAETEI